MMTVTVGSCCGLVSVVFYLSCFFADLVPNIGVR
jgi:hypothetical protein